MPNHGRLFQVMKGDTIGRTTVLSQFGRPQAIVLLVPILLSRCGWPPVVVSTRSKGMKSFSFLVISCIDESNVKDVFETSSNKDVLHGRVFVGETVWMIQAGIDEFSQCRLRQGIASASGIEKDFGSLSPLESSPPEKVFGCGICDQIGQDRPEVFWQDVQIFSSLKEEIKVFQIMRSYKSPNGSYFLPLD